MRIKDDSEKEVEPLKEIKQMKTVFEKSDSSYNPEFVEKIKKAEKSLEQGNYTKVNGQKELNDYLDSL